MPRCSIARRIGALGLWTTAALLHAAFAQDADVALTLDEAAALALGQQPLLQAGAAAVAAAQDRAVAAAQLPDPRLMGGVSNLTVTGDDRYTLRDESDTQFIVGVTQDFPRAEKRRLRGERGRREAEVADAELTAQRLAIARDAALAWIDAWRPERAAAVARATARQADLQAQAAEIAYRAGSAALADVLAARVESRRMQDEVAALEQEIAHGRNLLSRWIGADAERLLCPELPDWAPPPALDALLARLREHPHLDTARRQVALAQAEVDLAKAQYRPDWSAQLGYGYRPNFSDYVNLQLSVDLPLFAARRQDRQLAASLADVQRAEQLHEDLLRRHQAEARLNYADWQLLQDRIARYDREILPQGAERVEAARLAWQGGKGSLAAVLLGRRAELEDRLKRVELAADAARHRVQLLYLAGEHP